MNKIFNKALNLAILLLIVLPIITLIYSGDLAGNGTIKTINTIGAEEIKNFSSYDELRVFLSKHLLFNQGTHGSKQYFSPETATLSSSVQDIRDYSKTNVQVEGVDELDIVKTDGKYLYVASNNTVYIVMAYPPVDSVIASKIILNEKIIGMFLFSDKLAIIVDKYSNNNYAVGIKIYDIKEKDKPTLVTDLYINGFYFTSRAVNDYIYLIAKAPIIKPYKTLHWNIPSPEIVSQSINVPEIKLNEAVISIPATQIFYFSTLNATYYEYTIIVALNVKGNESPTIGTFLLGDASNLYMSLNNLYITSPARGMSSIDFMPIIARGFYKETVIYRFSVNGSNIKYEASGKVPGTILNQFSMDEHDGYFRVVTTRWEETPKNDVYILDVKDMKMISNITNLAPGEWIYSARFVGDRGYLVTFKKTDPLFVIDLSNPTHPKILGWLKIPGYSNYLHPYDETHVIGIGKDTIEAEHGDFAWYQGIKISLFDVSDPQNPKELAKYIIGDRGSDSPVLYDHKALLFDSKRKLLALPVLVAIKDQNSPPYEYGKPVWQGAYLFNVSLEKGFILVGKIAHLNVTDLAYNWSYNEKYFIKRIVYIDDALYTISDKMIKISKMDASEIKEINL